MLRINHQRQLVIAAQNDLSFTSVFYYQKHAALGLSDILSEITDIPTSQSVLKQKNTEKTNAQNNDDKAKKPTVGSYSISVKYCNICILTCYE